MGLPDSTPKEKMLNFTENLVFMYPNGLWYMRKMEKNMVGVITKSLVACICNNIKHYESISFASIPAYLL